MEEKVRRHIERLVGKPHWVTVRWKWGKCLGRRTCRVGYRLSIDDGQQSISDGLNTWYARWRCVDPGRSLEGHLRRVGGGLRRVAGGSIPEGIEWWQVELGPQSSSAKDAKSERQSMKKGGCDQWCRMRLTCQGDSIIKEDTSLLYRETSRVSVERCLVKPDCWRLRNYLEKM